MDLPKKGTRIELLSMPQDPNPIPRGTKGTVTGGVPDGPFATLYVAWDNGRTLNLIPGVDVWREVSE